MSDALNYLLQVRPDAMGSYFAFLREAGRHLDPRTKALISVITKVAAQSDAGFRQYLGRALAVGVTADEVLDALLLAFPILGLTRITWAADRLIEMNIPDFHPDRLLNRMQWHSVCRADELAPNSIHRLSVDDRAVFVRRHEDEIRVFDSRCPHQATDIPAEGIVDDTIVCPRHGWTFSLEDGSCVARGDQPLRCFESKVEGGLLYAFW